MYKRTILPGASATEAWIMANEVSDFAKEGDFNIVDRNNGVVARIPSEVLMREVAQMKAAYRTKDGCKGKAVRLDIAHLIDRYAVRTG